MKKTKVIAKMAGLLLGAALIVSGCGQKSSTDSQTKKSD